MTEKLGDMAHLESIKVKMGSEIAKTPKITFLNKICFEKAQRNMEEIE